jgi:hypothetical protein
MPDRRRALDARWYRTALWCCPPAFRREHGDEMSLDFEAARREAGARGCRALWGIRLLMAIDLVRTLGVQWVRTGIPALAVVSMLVPLAIAEALAAVVRRAPIPMPGDGGAVEVHVVLLLAVTSVILIAMTIAVSVLASRPIRRGRR